MKNFYLTTAVILLTALASCKKGGEDIPVTPPTPPPPSEEAIVLNQLQALYMGDAADGKTADLQMAFFNGAYGADIEGIDYEVLMIEAINEMPQSFDSFAIMPGRYEYAAEYSGVSGQFVGGGMESDLPKGTYFVKVVDGVKTIHIITGGQIDIIKGASYVMTGKLDGYIYGADEDTTFEEMEFYYSGPIAFENKDIPEGAIVLDKFFPEFFGDVFGTGSAFFATSFYNGDIDFNKGPVGAYEIFVMEAFNVMPADLLDFELGTGEYTLDSEYKGTPFKFVEGDPTEGSYKGTFYRKADALGNEVGYAFTGGTVNVTRYGDTYKVVANLDGYVFNPADQYDTSNVVEDVVFYYYGKAKFDIKATPPNQLNDGQGFYWGDVDGSGTDKIVLNLNQFNGSDPDVRIKSLGMTLYANKASYSDPNILIEEYAIPAGRYDVKNDKSAMSVMPGTFSGEYATSGSTYSEMGHDLGLPPTKLATVTSGYLVVSYPDGKFNVEIYFEGVDYNGAACEIGDWWFEGFAPMTDKRTIEYEALTPEFTSATLIYHETINNVGIAYLMLSSDEFSGGGSRYELSMEVRTHDQSATPEDLLILTPVDYGPDTNNTGERFTFKVGNYDATNKYLYRSYYQQIYTNEQTITAPVVINGGKISNVNNGSDGSIITIALEGRNMRTNRPVKVNAKYEGKIETVKQ